MYIDKSNVLITVRDTNIVVMIVEKGYLLHLEQFLMIGDFEVIDKPFKNYRLDQTSIGDYVINVRCFRTVEDDKLYYQVMSWWNRYSGKDDDDVDITYIQQLLNNDLN